MIVAIEGGSGSGKTTLGNLLSTLYDCTILHMDDFSLFLEISPKQQQERIRKRNAASLVKRFFEEWIPLENGYFTQMSVKQRCLMTIRV